MTTAISLSNLQSNFGGSSSPINLGDYYQGGSIMGPGVNPNTVPYSGVISLNNFSGVPVQYNWNYNQQTSGDQNNDGSAWSVDYINGPLGWGLYASVYFYTDGRQPGAFSNYACSQFIKFSTNGTVVTSNPNGNVGQTRPSSSTGNSAANGPTGGVINGYQDNSYGDGIYWLGYITGYWNSSNNSVYITGSYGSGGPGDAGYSYATGQTRGNWSGLCGGGNTLVVVV